jgi:hypothetical protein
MREQLRQECHLRKPIATHERARTVPNVALSHAERARIDSDREDAKPCRPGPVKGRFGRFAPTDEVELIPPRSGASRRDVFQPAPRDRGKGKPHARFRGRSCPAHLASRAYQSTKSHRRQEEGHGQVRAENLGAQVTTRDRNRIPRAKRDFFKGAAIFTQSDFTVGAAVNIIEDNAWKTAFGSAAQISDIDDARRSHSALFSSHLGASSLSL